MAASEICYDSYPPRGMMVAAEGPSSYRVASFGVRS